MEQDRAPAVLPNHRQLARPTTGNLPNRRQPHRQHHHRDRTHRTRRSRPQPLPNQNQTHRTTEEVHTPHPTQVPRRLELHDPTARRIDNFIPAPNAYLEISLSADGDYLSHEVLLQVDDAGHEFAFLNWFG